MAEAAMANPLYVGLSPAAYKSFVLGLERVSTVWPELVSLGAKEWEEVGDQDRLGDFMPDFVTSLKHERAGAIGVVTVRRRETGELCGYFVGVLGSPLKTKGQRVLNEVGVYLAPDARGGWLAAKLLDYTEKVARHFGANALIVSHRPEHARIGVLYQRQGFKPLSVDYIKRIDP